MANLRLPTATRNAKVNAAVDLLDPAGVIKIYAGTQPASGGGTDNSATHVLLATLLLASVAFGSAASGTATANSISNDASADASGTATWFRAETSGGTVVFDGDVGTSGATLNLNTTAFTQGGAVSITSFTYTQPAA